MMSNSSHYYGMPNGFPMVQQTYYQLPQVSSEQLPSVVQNDTKGPMMSNVQPHPNVDSSNCTWPADSIPGATPMQPNGAHSPPHGLGAPKPYGMPPAGSMFPQQQQQPSNQRVAALAGTNGNSANSSRTSSPALGSNGPQMPPSERGPVAGVAYGVNNNMQPPVSSQNQPQTVQGPPASVSGYKLNPNNNWSSGAPVNFVNTPPRNASGLSTPLNASTPNLNGPPGGGVPMVGTGNTIQKLSESVRDINLNRPPSAGVVGRSVAVAPATGSHQQQQGPNPPQHPSVLSNGLTNSPPVNGPPVSGSLTNPSLPSATSYGHLPPPLNQHLQKQTLPNQLQHHPPSQQTPLPGGGSLAQPLSTNGLANHQPPIAQSLASSYGPQAVPPQMAAAGQPLNKRPMYPAIGKPSPTLSQPTTAQPMTASNFGQQQQGGAWQAHNPQQFPPQQQHPPQQDYQQQQQRHQQQQQQYQQQTGYGTPASPAYPGDVSSNVVRGGFNRLWGNNSVDLLQNRHVLPTDRVRPPPIHLVNPFQDSINCNPDIFRCTLTKIPETSALLQKSRLPLGVLIHPFRDLNNLPVISCNTIVRCRTCRTYINPFVFFVDSKKWKCNLCYRVNELPEEFQYDPVTKTYGDPTRRPEIKSSTIEFIAPSEYMLRPPQPAIYLFLLDVSSLAQQSGYLHTVCNTLTEHLDNLPGDARTQVGFIAFNSAIHFYNIAEGYSQPHEVTVLDVEDVFLPYPDNLLVNLKECKELIKDLLKQLPKRFEFTHDANSALGAALQVAYKMMNASGGRVTVFQTCLPNFGPGALQSREDPNNRSSKDVAHLGPATDFYKRLALDCSGQQIAVDLFLLNSQYCDLATISGISKFSGGCLHHIPLYNETKPQLVKTLRKCFERYLMRKIGFEAVMRVRCTRGLAIHTFHGNFFVRSTDLLSLPNVNPDAGFGMQITYEESLAECKSVCFQAALLYTSSKAERRIRVHTLCIPVTASLMEVMYSADVQCIVGLLSKMAVDRSLSSSLSDARDAFINATVDIFSAFKIAQNLPQNSNIIVAPENLGLLPLYVLALLKHPAFRTGTSTRLDDRVYAMCEMKSLPLDQLMRYIYPEFYVLDCLFVTNTNGGYMDDEHKMDPPRLQLSAEKLDSRSMFLLDCGPYMFIYIGSNVASSIVHDILGYNSVADIPDFCIELPSRETAASEALLTFLDNINEEKPYTSYVQVIRDTSQFRSLLVEKFVDDRNPNSLAYYEFLQHLRTQIK